MLVIAIMSLSLSMSAVRSCSSEKELVFVQAMFRHGDRAPLDLPYPNDQNKNDSWVGGWRSLTEIGKQQATDLGRFFRLRYPGLISDQYNESEVFMLSSYVERTVLSAEYVFRGLYPNRVPPKVLTSGEDNEEYNLMVTPPNCDAQTQLKRRDRAVTIEENDKRYADVYQFLQPLTGYENFTTESMYNLYAIKKEIIHNMTVPDWVHKRWPQHGNRTTLEIATEIRTLLWLSSHGSLEKAKGDAGYTLHVWIEDSMKLAKREQVEKLKLYSTHDNYVMDLMYTMGIGNEILVPYAASVIWELYKHGDNYEVEVYYRNETFTDYAYPMQIPGCGCPCLLSKLPSLYKNAVFSTVEEREQYCNHHQEPQEETTTQPDQSTIQNSPFWPTLSILPYIVAVFMY